MNNYKESQNPKKKDGLLEVAAEQWLNLCLAQIVVQKKGKVTTNYKNQNKNGKYKI